MRALLALLFLLLSFQTYCQSNRSKNGIGFDSFFQSLKEGNFSGEVSGELTLKKASGEEMKYGFQKQSARLDIVTDPNEVYDVSRKVYSCSKGGLSVAYSTYAEANAIEINIDKMTCELSLIDGGCDMVINGLEYVYKQTEKQEMLYLFFTGNVGLSQKRTSTDPVYYVRPGSMLIFTINK